MDSERGAWRVRREKKKLERSEVHRDRKSGRETKRD